MNAPRFLALAMAVAILAPGPAFAAGAPPLVAGAMTPSAAVDLALQQDGDRVAVQGEALGEALVAPRGMRWVNLLGGGVALGVVVESSDAALIERFGEYRQRGATVLVRGTLNSACDEHGGDLDMHAATFEILDQGETIPHAVHPAKLVLSLVSVAFAILLLLRYRHLRRLTYLT